MTQVDGVNPGEVVADSSFDKLQDNARVIDCTAARRHAAQPRAYRRNAVRLPPAPARPRLERHRHAVNPSRPFILRPVATSLLMAAILLIGIVGYTQLPVSALPQVDYPTIQVVTFYPGASPDVMATTVTAPLERQFGQMQGLSQMTSTSSGGTSVIVLQFSSEPEHRRRRTGSAGGDQCLAEPAALEPARARRSTARPIRPTRRC